MVRYLMLDHGTQDLVTSVKELMEWSGKLVFLCMANVNSNDL